MTNLKTWFDRGMSTYEYLHSMKINKDHTLTVFNDFQLETTDVSFLQTLQNQELKAIILTADWCGDAMVNIPIFLKIANSAFIEPRFLIRDENLELMDQYLTNGKSRSIPIIILLNNEFEEIGRWGPRASLVQTEVDELRKSLPDKESEGYEQAFKVFIRQLVDRFTTDQTWWKAIKEDMLNTLK